MGRITKQQRLSLVLIHATEMWDLMMYVAFPVLVIALLAERFDIAYWFVKLVDSLETWCYDVSLIAFLPLLILCAIKPIRLIGVLSMRLIGRFSIFIAVFSSAASAYVTLGGVGLIVSSLMAGVGVVPAAIFGLFRSHKTIDGWCLLGVIVGAVVCSGIGEIGFFRYMQKLAESEAV